MGMHITATVTLEFDGNNITESGFEFSVVVDLDSDILCHVMAELSVLLFSLCILVSSDRLPLFFLQRIVRSK